MRKPVDESLPHIRDLLVDVCGHGGEPLQVRLVIGDGPERRCLNELRERRVKSVVAQERDSPELERVVCNVVLESEGKEVVVELIFGIERRSIDRLQPIEILQACFVLRFVGSGGDVWQPIVQIVIAAIRRRDGVPCLFCSPLVVEERVEGVGGRLGKSKGSREGEGSDQGECFRRDRLHGTERGV